MPANEAWGLDIGQTAIHAVKVRREGRRAVIDDAYIQELVTWPDDPEYEDKVLDALQTFAERKNVGKTPVVAGIPGFMTIFRDFPTPMSSKLREVVALEIKQRIPYKIEEVFWDYHQMSFDGVGEVTIGAVCCRRDIVYGILGILDQAKLSIDAMQVASIGLMNYVAFDVPAEDDAAQIVIDSGARGTDLVIFHEDAFWLRPLGTSGQDLTRALMSKLSIPFDQAEQMKLAIARGGAQSDRAFRVLEPVLKGLASETQRSLGYYRAQNRGVQIRKRLLLGGNVYKLTGAAEFLAESMDMTTEFMGHPKTMSVDDAASGELEKHWMVIGSAIGLAIQGVGLARVETNLLPRDRQVARAIQSKFKYAAIAVGLVGATALFNAALSGGIRNADRYRMELTQADEVEKAVNEQRRRFNELKDNSVKPEAEARTLVARATTPGDALEAQTEIMAWFDRFNGPPLADRKPDQSLERWAGSLVAGQRTGAVKREAMNVARGLPKGNARQPSANAEQFERYEAAKKEYGAEWPMLLANLEEQLYTRAYWLAERAGRLVPDRIELVAGNATPPADPKGAWQMSPALTERFHRQAGDHLPTLANPRDANAMGERPVDPGQNFSFATTPAAPTETMDDSGRPVVAVALSGHVILSGVGNPRDFLPMQAYLEDIHRRFAAMEGILPGSFKWEARMPPEERNARTPIITPQIVPKPEPVVRPSSAGGLLGRGAGAGMDGMGMGMGMENPSAGAMPGRATAGEVAGPRAISYDENYIETVTVWRVSFLYQPRAEREAAKAAAEAAKAAQ